MKGLVLSIVVVDYGMGNLNSVAKALEFVADGVPVVVSQRAEDIVSADRVVFPGQGAMPACMAELKRCGLAEAVVSAAKQKPFLGICIGLQLLFETSEEGAANGLGLFKGCVRRLTHTQACPEGAKDITGVVQLKIPHMGWNRVQHTRQHPLWEGIADETRFYFVHSYYVVPDDSSLVMATTWHGERFTVAVASGSVCAVQYHPEKSGPPGLQLLRNFVHWQPA